ncbi:MAG: flavin reductase family protein [Planctomycetales bacterium]|nr:flavin reductase family protein [Planctomycetales bacterium]
MSNANSDPPNVTRDLTSISDVMRIVNREIWVVTAAAGNERGGLVATWVSAASIDDQAPTVLVGLAPNHYTTQLVEQSGSLTLHLLRESQLDVAWNFALGSGHDRDKLATLEYLLGATDAPRLRDCLAWLDCRVFARLATGDRHFYWADVVAASRVHPGDALREHQLFASATPEQRQQLIANRDADITLQLPAAVSWRELLPEYLYFQPSRPSK